MYSSYPDAYIKTEGKLTTISEDNAILQLNGYIISFEKPKSYRLSSIDIILICFVSVLSVILIITFVLISIL